jgi:hypothetical protein
MHVLLCIKLLSVHTRCNNPELDPYQGIATFDWPFVIIWDNAVKHKDMI